jgi:glycosyltransferase involved in cell wall biosynthesis
VSLSILWLGRTLPLPLNSGDRIYSARLVGAVARAGARVTYLGLQNPDEKMGELGVLEPGVRWQLVPGEPRNRLIALLSPLPLVGARFATASYRQALARELTDGVHDVIVFDQYALSWALEDVRHLARNRPLLVHLAHDFETEVTAQISRNFRGNPVRKVLLTRNAAKTRLAEQALAQRCDLLASLTDHDSAAFASINPRLQTIVLPPGYSGPRQGLRLLDTTVPRRVIIVGSFSWIAKQMNLRRFLEAASLPFAQHGIEIRVVGFVPESVKPGMRAKFPEVTFCGVVEDLSGEFKQARLALVPEETGGGFKLKTLDYIFARVPVAALAPALNGISDQLKSQFLVAEDLRSLVARIVDVVDDIAHLNDMQNGAFSLAENLFDWEANGRAFVRSVETAIAKMGAT